jgi:hypothetical protein
MSLNYDSTLHIPYQLNISRVKSYVHTRGGGRIQISDLRCMRRGPQPIELSLRDVLSLT